MYKVSFVILHYLSEELTDKCICSILDNISFDNYNIVVVDNGSPNGSGEALKKKYIENSKVSVLLVGKNLGFSRGNNLGYKYAKNELKSDFVIIINNDTILEQKDFIEKCVHIYSEENYYVLGPDVINLDGLHQSPQRNHVVSTTEVFVWFVKRLLIYCLVLFLKLLKSDYLKSSFCNKYNMRERKRIVGYVTDRRQDNIEIQGSCFVFSPMFINENEIAFEELTFMYGEEATLAWKCKKRGWKLLYDPTIKIKHLDKQVTGEVQGSEFGKWVFYSKHDMIAVWKLYLYIIFYKKTNTSSKD